MDFRDLRADEIDVRIGQSNAEGGYITLLLYKDARVDMSILDSSISPGKWQRKHYILNSVIYCSVGIYIDEIGEWVWKDDCGSEGNIEKDKSAASDSFKRSCTVWGIGRELYTAPVIKIQCEFTGTTRLYPTLKDFSVEKIVIDQKKIKALSITAYNSLSKKRERVFVWMDDDLKIK